MKDIILNAPRTNSDGFQIYDLDDGTCRKLIAEGEAALKFTYPDSGKGYSVALVADSGKVHTGASYNSDTHNTTMHGEAVCLARAAQHGETRIVAITGPNCHNCKQLIWESSIRSRIDTLVIFLEDGAVKKIPISELMPYPWPDKNGAH